MPNKVVSQDIDTLLTKSTKEEAATFLGLEDIKAQWGNVTGSLSNQTDLVTILNSFPSASDVDANTAKVGITPEQASAIVNNTADINSANDAIQTVENSLSSSISANASNIATNANNIASEVTSRQQLGNIVVGQGNDITDLFNDKVNKINPIFTGTAVLGSGNTTMTGNVIISSHSRSLTKQKCYFKNGGVRLQKDSSSSDEISMRYEGANSNNFVIEQYINSVRLGYIKFIGDQQLLRLSCDTMEVGTLGDTVKLKGTTQVGDYQKFVFKDSRTEEHGLHFEHSGNENQAVQMGMYGNYEDDDYSQFKITHKDGASGYSNVLTVGKNNSHVELHPSVGIKTNGAPSAALDVNGTIKANDINVNSKAFYVDGTHNYIQAEKYGEGNFATLTGSENQPKTTPAFGNNGKVVENTYIKTFKIVGSGFVGLDNTPVTIVPKEGIGKYIVPQRMTVYNDYGTRSGSWGNNGAVAAMQIGTFQNSNNTGNFAALLTIPQSTANTNGDWLAHKTIRNAEVKQFANRDLCLKSLNNIATEANAPDGAWYVRLEYMIIGESAGFENNVDQTIGTPF